MCQVSMPKDCYLLPVAESLRPLRRHRRLIGFKFSMAYVLYSCIDRYVTCQCSVTRSVPRDICIPATNSEGICLTLDRDLV